MRCIVTNISLSLRVSVSTDRERDKEGLIEGVKEGNRVRGLRRESVKLLTG